MSAAVDMSERMSSDRGPAKPIEPPPDIAERVGRAQARMRAKAPTRNCCYEFFRNNTYSYVNNENRLVGLATAGGADSRGKPRHRVRSQRGGAVLLPLIQQTVSNATQKVPGYEIIANNTDQDTFAAAKIAEKVAQYGYVKWGLKRVTESVVTHAIVADQGFAWPFWDDTVGPVVGDDVDENGDPTGRDLHQGDIRVRILGANQVGWEPGIPFEDSPYYIVVEALTPEQVKAIDGYIPGGLTPDATDQVVIGKGMPIVNKLVLVTHYLERPSQRHKNGRRLALANNRVIARLGDYPLSDVDGVVLDEPVIHKLSVIRDPDSDSDLGLVRFALDIVRTYQDCWNKVLEWKNFAMNPQMIIPTGTSAGTTPLTDEPGAVFETPRPELLQWRTAPQIPPQLLELMDRCVAELGRLFSQNDIPNQVDTAQGINALVTRDQSTRAAFLANLAEFHGRLMSHCLMLVVKHYTEKRLISLNGKDSVDPIRDFKGADMMNQTTCTVLPGSLESKTREENQREVMALAQLQLLSREEILSSIQSGSTDNLSRGYELDVSRANRLIQQIFAAPESVLAVTPADGPGAEPQWWMPRQQDSVSVYKQAFGDATKTERFDTAPPQTQAMLELVYQGICDLELQQQQQAQMVQSMQAEQLGAANAAAPQTGTPMPSVPDGLAQPGGSRPAPTS